MFSDFIVLSAAVAVVTVTVVTVVVRGAVAVTVVRVVGVEWGVPAVLAVVYGGGDPTVVVAAVVLRGIPPATNATHLLPVILPWFSSKLSKSIQ